MSTRPPQAPHVLIITGDDEDDWESTIECPGGDDRRCRAVYECMECNAAIRRGDEALRDQLDETGIAHGVDHVNHSDIGWATESDHCWLKVSDDACDAINDLFPRETDPRGRYLVVVDDPDPLTLAFAPEEPR